MAEKKRIALAKVALGIAFAVCRFHEPKPWSFTVAGKQKGALLATDGKLLALVLPEIFHYSSVGHPRQVCF